ncbi:Protein-lysine N-methyltransferase EFM2 [Cytospora mali]|uniref:Protein-lysine N-methyltransferase EFM2 n=1 Tax=Cytospora mali TaxID=578113 RepID=A0A194VS22_CYTMA|nr:Protein-lysine N-methyltransferase EFM2 [Valsa mali]
MRPLGHLLHPTSSLPRLRCSSPDDLTEDKIDQALHNLRDIYCPLPRAVAFRKPSLALSQGGDYLTVPVSTTSNTTSGTSTPQPIDSGYASGDDDDDNNEDKADNGCDITDTDHIATLRADEYERQFTVRWLTSFIARAEELLDHIDEDMQQRLIDDASYILASFSSATNADEDEDAGAIVREFSFELVGSATQEEGHHKIDVRLTDGTPAIGTDHTDVGLQSWGASIVISDMMCSHPERFGLTAEALGAEPRIIELGAGTGLVGITMAKLLPRLGIPDAEIIATDYHPAVLANLHDNVVANFPSCDEPAVKTCLLDWSAPCLDAPLHKLANMLVATDVVYAPEHAVWLRDCAAKLLAPDGVFWLIASVRPNGRFEGVTDTVEDAFVDVNECPRSQDGCRVLRILSRDRHEKRKGVGRADEIGYKVFRIGWEAIQKVEVSWIDDEGRQHGII